MTRSEVFSIMTVGLATVAGSVLVGYALLGVPLEYLLAATFMTAPAGLLMAKMIMPETASSTAPDEPAAAAFDAESPDDRAANVFDAAAKAAIDGLRVAAGVGALLVAFISLIQLLNIILGAAGELVGFEGLTFQLILGYVFAPVAFVVGVPWSEAVPAGNFLGQKLILNEFVAFAEFGPQAEQFSERTVAVVTFALCGFANFGSFAILLGALAELAPRRRPLVASLGLKAILAGTLANLLNAAVAGMVIAPGG
jgi:CNT family concentrative nucleoside transporter